MGLSLNKNINLDFIKNNEDKILWGTPGLSSNNSFKWNWITEYPNKNWDFYIISKNIDLNDINKIPEKHINMVSICFNQNLTWKYISENPKLKWDFDIISYNKTVTWNIIKNNPNYFNNYYYISCNRNIDFDIFYNNIEKTGNTLI